MRPNQQVGLSCVTLSSPCSAFMSRKSKTSLLKGRVRDEGGDGASAKCWQAQQHTNMSAVRTRIGLSFATSNIQPKINKHEHMKNCETRR